MYMWIVSSELEQQSQNINIARFPQGSPISDHRHLYHLTCRASVGEPTRFAFENTSNDGRRRVAVFNHSSCHEPVRKVLVSIISMTGSW